MFILDLELTPFTASEVWPLGERGETCPVLPYLIYTDPSSATELNDDDDNGNDLADFHGMPRACLIQSTAADIWFSHGYDPAVSIGIKLVADTIYILKNQKGQMETFRFIKHSGTPVVMVVPMR